MTGVAAEVGSTANNYEILARLASGGMAEIFLARGTSTTGVERYVVLKRILRERADDEQLVRMFLDEARLAAQLQHPNVAQVYDIGKLGDSYFFTMEYVHGETVRALLHRARSLRREVPLNVILTVIAGAAAGLHHAHERLSYEGKPLGIVHRDVSPSNLMLSYEGSVKVVDFGVAKAENRAQETRSGTVKGKIAYLSPEQCRGASVDRRSDLFSLGIVFWEMLTVERLYRRASDFDNMTAIVTEPPIPPSTRHPGIPKQIDDMVLRLLSKEADDRFQTADQLVEAIENIAPEIGAMVSSSSVGRLLRDMFGQRPEPWLEMDATLEVPASPAATTGVTVTSEPIPKELVSAPANSVDNLLQQVRTLPRQSTAGGAMPVEGSDHSGPVSAHSGPIPAAAAPTVPLTAPRPPEPEGTPSGAPARVAAANPTAPTQPATPSATMHGFPTPRPQHASGSYPPQQQPRQQPLPQQPGDPTFGASGSSSGEHSHPLTYPRVSSSSAHGFLTGSESAYPMVSTQERARSQRWPMLAIVIGAAVIGSLTVFLAMRGGGGDTTTAADAAQLANAPADAGDLPVPDTATPGDALATISVPDAGVEVAIDATAAAIDAAAPLAVDAAVVPADTAKHASVDAQKSALRTAMDEGRYAAAVHECTKTFSSHIAALCTLAACRAGQESRAQRWYPRIPGSSARRGVATSCHSSGIDVIKKRPPPPPKPRDAGVDPCAANPMACPH